MPLSSWTMGCLICSLVFIGACSSTGKVRVTALNAPGGSNPEAASAVKAGNQAFAAGQWAVAKQQYEKAIGVQETLAEAHYNLGLDPGSIGPAKASRGALYRGREFRSRAPGHWNSRIYRRYGDVTPAGGGGLPSIPGLGGLGGIGGGGSPGGTPPGGF